MERCFTNLMEGIECSLLSKNRDKYAIIINWILILWLVLNSQQHTKWNITKLNSVGRSSGGNTGRGSSLEDALKKNGTVTISTPLLIRLPFRSCIVSYNEMRTARMGDIFSPAWLSFTDLPFKNQCYTVIVMPMSYFLQGVVSNHY